MTNEWIAALAAAVILGAASWVLGWFYGSETLRHRQRKLIQELHRYSEETEALRDTAPDVAYWKGYALGLHDAIKTVDDFLAQYLQEDKA